jgi:6-phosphogluconate dehydrogenase
MATKCNPFDKEFKTISACSHFQSLDEKQLLRNLRIIVKYALAFTLPIPSAPSARNFLESRRKVSVYKDTDIPDEHR